MGCCVGGSLRDEEIDRASTMFELINVMKRKKENMAKESAEVEAYLQDPSNKLTMATFNGVTKEDLKKRPPYLAKLSHAYQEAIDRLQETPNVNTFLIFSSRSKKPKSTCIILFNITTLLMMELKNSEKTSLHSRNSYSSSKKNKTNNNLNKIFYF